MINQCWPTAASTPEFDLCTRFGLAHVVTFQFTKLSNPTTMPDVNASVEGNGRPLAAPGR